MSKRRTNRRRLDELRPFIKTGITIFLPCAVSPGSCRTFNGKLKAWFKRHAIPARAVWEGPLPHVHLAIGCEHNQELEDALRAFLRRRWLDWFDAAMPGNALLWKPDIQPDRIASYLKKTWDSRAKGHCVKGSFQWCVFSPHWEVGFAKLSQRTSPNLSASQAVPLQNAAFFNESTPLGIPISSTVIGLPSKHIEYSAENAVVSECLEAHTTVNPKKATSTATNGNIAATGRNFARKRCCIHRDKWGHQTHPRQAEFSEFLRHTERVQKTFYNPRECPLTRQVPCFLSRWKALRFVSESSGPLRRGHRHTQVDGNGFVTTMLENTLLSGQHSAQIIQTEHGARGGDRTPDQLGVNEPLYR